MDYAVRTKLTKEINELCFLQHIHCRIAKTVAILNSQWSRERGGKGSPRPMNSVRKRIRAFFRSAYTLYFDRGINCEPVSEKIAANEALHAGNEYPFHVVLLLRMQDSDALRNRLAHFSAAGTAKATRTAKPS